MSLWKVIENWSHYLDAPAIPLGSLWKMPSQGCTLTQTHNQDAPLNLSPPSRVLCFYTIYLTRDNTAQRVWCGVQSSRIFVALWPTCIVLSRYVSSPVAATHLVIRKTSNKISRKKFKSKNQLGGARVIFPRPGSLWFWET